METISNMANTAAKAVWGTSASHEEPISGKSGDVSKGEPYDAGNIGGAYFGPPLLPNLTCTDGAKPTAEYLTRKAYQAW